MRSFSERDIKGFLVTAKQFVRSVNEEIVPVLATLDEGTLFIHMLPERVRKKRIHEQIWFIAKTMRPSNLIVTIEASFLPFKDVDTFALYVATKQAGDLHHHPEAQTALQVMFIDFVSKEACRYHAPFQRSERGVKFEKWEKHELHTELGGDVTLVIKKLFTEGIDH